MNGLIDDVNREIKYMCLVSTSAKESAKRKRDSRGNLHREETWRESDVGFGVRYGEMRGRCVCCRVSVVFGEILCG